MANIGVCKAGLKSCDESFVNGINDREAYPKHWIAILVQMNTEQKVSCRLNKIGVTNYVPVRTEIHQWSDRKKKIVRVMIPMVVFVLVDDVIEKELRRLPYVHRFIYYPGQKEAAIIPDEQIEKLKFMMNNAETGIEVSDSVYEVGEEVDVVCGPLKGLSGRLCYFEKDKPMVGIHIELLGYACVRVNRSHVKSKNK